MAETINCWLPMALIVELAVSVVPVVPPISVPLWYNFRSADWLELAVSVMTLPFVHVCGSGTGSYLGCDGGASMRTARLLVYIGTYMSLPSVLRCALQAEEQFPSRNKIAMLFRTSPGANPKNTLGLLIVYCHLLALT